MHEARPVTTEPTFSVIMPTYNRGPMIDRAIQSVLNQTRSDLELLIVDDASNDDTQARIVALKEPRIRYLRHESRKGAGAARNTGIEAAVGKYVAFLDSDDEWLPHKLERQLATFEASDLGNVGIVTCGETGLDGGGRRTTRLPARRGWILEDLLAQRPIGCRTSALFVRRDVLTDHGVRFDPKLPARQDYDFVLSVARVSQMEIVREPLLLVHHHEGERVWTPARAIDAGTYLHDKLKDELEQRPHAHNLFHLRIALTCMAGGDWAQARGQIREAIKASPWRPISYLWLALAKSGTGEKPSRAQRAAMRLLRPLTF